MDGKCNHHNRKIYNSRKCDGYVRRRNYCFECKEEFSTVEVEVVMRRGKNGLESLNEQYGHNIKNVQIDALISVLKSYKE